MKSGSSRQAVLWLGILPAVGLLLALAIYPLGQAVYLSGFEYSLAEADPSLTWVGWQQYEKAWHDTHFGQAVGNTLLFGLGSVSLEVLLGIGVGAWLHQQVLAGWRWLVLLPLAISPAVAALVWKALYHPELGWISQGLHQIQIPVPRGLPGEVSTALLSLVVVDVWQWTPLVALTVWVGLRSHDRQWWEAAQLDGASGWQYGRWIALPLLKPVLLTTVLLRSVAAVQVFDSATIITAGGPGSATEMVSTYLFKMAFTYFDLGYSSALAVLILIGTGSLLVLGLAWGSVHRDP